MGNRCDGNSVGQSVGMRISTGVNTVSISSENQNKFCENHSDSSMVANNTLVPVSQRSVSCSTDPIEPEKRGSVSTPIEILSSRDTNSQPSCVAFVRRRLQMSGLSKEAIDLNIKGICDSTSRVYDNHWKKWCMLCADNQIDPANPSAVYIANHLAFMSRSFPLSASSLKVRKATISSTLAAFGHSGLSSNKIVNNVIKACLLYTSPSPRDLSTSRMPSSA